MPLSSSLTKLRVGTIANQRAQVSSGGANANANDSVDRLSRIVPLRPRGCAPLRRFGDEERIANVDQVSEVAIEHETLDDATNGTERGRELDAIGHASAVLDSCEQVLMAERLEGTSLLLVHETSWAVPLGDHARHRPGPAKMPRTPRHELAQLNLTFDDSADGPLAGTRERIDV